MRAHPDAPKYTPGGVLAIEGYEAYASGGPFAVLNERRMRCIHPKRDIPESVPNSHVVRLLGACYTHFTKRVQGGIRTLASGGAWPVNATMCAIRNGANASVFSRFYCSTIFSFSFFFCAVAVVRGEGDGWVCSASILFMQSYHIFIAAESCTI